MSLLKRFTDTIPDTTEWKEYQSFTAFNKAIEDENISPEDALQAYHDVLLDTISDLEKTTLHWQMKYLIEESKIAVNKIHKFISFKFPSWAEIMKDIILNSPALQHSNSSALIELLSSDQHIVCIASIKWIGGDTIDTIHLDMPFKDSEEDKVNKLKIFISAIEKHYKAWKSAGVSIMVWILESD